MTSAKQADHGWQEIDAGGRAGADDEGATLEAVDLLDGPSAVGNRRDDSRGVGFEHPPGLGRRSPASAAPREEPRTQFPLEFGNVLGQRRLRQIDAAGRATEVLLPCDRQEDLQLLQRHSGFPYRFDPNIVLDPIAVRGVSQERKEARMIFRQFLAPKTGCASYLFG